MFQFGKKKKTVDYLEKEILRFSLGCQELLKRWLTEEWEKNGGISLETFAHEMSKYFAAINTSITIEVKRDFSEQAGEKLTKMIGRVQKEGKDVDGELLLEFAYLSIMNERPPKDVEDKGRNIAGTQYKLCKVTIDEVIESHKGVVE